MPPAPVMAKSAVCHSGRLVANRPTRSPGFDAEFDKGHGEAGDAAEEFGGGDRVPGIVAAEQLGARVGERIDGVQEARREGCRRSSGSLCGVFVTVLPAEFRSLYSNRFAGAIPMGRRSGLWLDVDGSDHDRLIEAV